MSEKYIDNRKWEKEYGKKLNKQREVKDGEGEEVKERRNRVKSEIDVNKGEKKRDRKGR